MNSKALLFLAMLLASILLSSAETAPKDLDKNLDNQDEFYETNGVDESQYVGGPWRGGGSGYGGGGYGGGHYGGRYCHHGCCDWGYHGSCRRCCYPREHHVADIDAEPHN
ncbi:putative glycine rich protein [Medicago truncatula]|uniref:Putative glycine rich protein n=1 Tax=Medicago truncatula TaxID=3880 RepID=A0A072VGY5_MEDTR|nr:glycine-rich protein [Medicago truncatula]KEH40708.1 hypothetical protein MTR_1g033630 [Medicago truncatula]RHN78126.1 putative glycine rich protein [Medicago truncatula]